VTSSVSALRDDVRRAVASGAIGSRVWFYATYRCNLVCTYCLTESGPRAEPRALAATAIRRLAEQALDLGFTAFGVTGGEPLLDPAMPELLAYLGARAPTVVLTNATLAGERLLPRLRPLAGSATALQISLDSADAAINDAARGRGSFARAVAAIRRLRDAGIRVRIGTTVDDGDPEALDRLCALHRSLGIDDADHVVRPIVRRGRAATNGLGIAVDAGDMPPELTVTAEGVYDSPVGPTVRDGKLATDRLLVRTCEPLALGVRAMLAVRGARAPDATAPRVA